MDKTAQDLLQNLASSIRASERSSPENRQMWESAVSNRLEALALYINHGVIPSTYEDERDAQVQACDLAPLYRASGTY